MIHLHDTANTLRRLVTKLGSIFYMQSYMFYNLLSWTLAFFKFIIVLHYMTCFWILMQFREDNEFSFFETNNLGYIYADSFYFMTTTISTVGYGDYKAFDVDNTDWMLGFSNMLYISIVIIAGILLFTIVTNEIFNYKKLKTVR